MATDPLWSEQDSTPIRDLPEFPWRRLTRLVALWKGCRPWGMQTPPRTITLEKLMERVRKFHVEYPRAHFTYRNVAATALVLCCGIGIEDSARICGGGPLALPRSKLEGAERSCVGRYRN